MNTHANPKEATDQIALDESFLRGGAEISLFDVLDIIKETWKAAIFGAFLGLIGSIAYLIMAPKMYESIAQIRMAQISQINPANFFGTPVEDPGSLVGRMQFPTNYSSELLNACEYEDSAKGATLFAKDVKFSIPKGIANTVEIKILSPSPLVAKICMQGVVRQIQILQEEMSRPFVEEARIKLASDDERINDAKKLIAKADQNGSATSAAYLSARDELTYFLTDREKMMDLINSVKNRSKKLYSPIYVSDVAVWPKKVVSLMMGLLSGLFLGFLVRLVRLIFLRFKGQSGCAL
jgi:hypothetical protein